MTDVVREGLWASSLVFWIIPQNNEKSLHRTGRNAKLIHTVLSSLWCLQDPSVLASSGLTAELTRDYFGQSLSKDMQKDGREHLGLNLNAILGTLLRKDELLLLLLGRRRNS